MSILSRFADRLVLQPTTRFVEPNGLVRHVITTPESEIEAWTTRSKANHQPHKLLLLKFPGTGGRAERSSLHPAEAWPQAETEAWTFNHRGYGGSTGPASLDNFKHTCDAAYKAATTQFPGHHVVVYGNSLGCLSALYISANHPVHGAYLRNPPPLANMIATRPRYAAWSFGFSRWIAKQIPLELDSLENARQSTCPALFIQSELDRVVPTSYQDQVIAAYAGPIRKLVLAGADHHHRAPEEQLEQYGDAVRWLGDQAIQCQ
ncbi:MAG: pimeloyl-ACP methyl ester carboxylesterase [Mariniblastus sp.]|jgi:pimeloyl-ACP methyl ester carboxylesterase